MPQKNHGEVSTIGDRTISILNGGQASYTYLWFVPSTREPRVADLIGSEPSLTGLQGKWVA